MLPSPARVRLLLLPAGEAGANAFAMFETPAQTPSPPASPVSNDRPFITPDRTPRQPETPAKAGPGELTDVSDAGSSAAASSSSCRAGEAGAK